MPTKELLEQIYAEIETRVEAKLRKRIEALEADVERWKEESRVWKARYYREQERSKEFENQLSLSRKKVAELEDLIQKQKVRIAGLEKIVHGKKSEVTKPPSAPAEQPEKRMRGRENGAKGYGRKKRETLEPVEIIHDFLKEECLCESCGMPFEPAGEKQSEEIEVEIQVRKLVHRRKTVRRTCQCPSTPRIKTAAAPLKLFKGSAYSIGFWHYVIFEKYHLQRPTNRTCKLLSSYGLDLGPSVIVSGLKRLHNEGVFKPLLEAIEARVRAAKRQQKDETGWKIFQEIEGKQSNQHWLWATLTDDCCLFQLDPSRSREVAKRTIGDGPVVVTSDMLKVYDKLGDNVTNSWCWAHVRRYILALGSNSDLLEQSQSWLKKIDWLYHCNNERLKACSEDEFLVHDEKLRKAIAEFKSLASRQAKNHKVEAVRKVFKMIVEHWDGLQLFVELPSVPMDNNLTEQALRNAVVGRKCYYGSGACWSGELAANLFSIFTTLEMNGINPRTWLFEYLTAVAKNGGRAPPDALTFLPWNNPSAEHLSN